MALAVMAALLLAMALAKRMGLDRDRIWTLGLLAVFSAIAGSKLFGLFANWSSFMASPRLLLSLPALQSQGVDYAGILLALLIAAAYLAYSRLPLLRTLDVVAPSLALGQGIASIGCLMAGCDYGQPHYRRRRSLGHSLQEPFCRAHDRRSSWHPALSHADLRKCSRPAPLRSPAFPVSPVRTRMATSPAHGSSASD